MGKFPIIENVNLIYRIPSYLKKTIVITSDIFLCFFSTWLAFVLRLDKIVLLADFNYYTAILSAILLYTIFLFFGLYKTIFRYTGLSIILNIFISIIIYGFLFFLIIGVFGIKGVPRSIGIIQPTLLFFFIISFRLFIKFLLSSNKILKSSSIKKNILIYGAGDAGRQLVIALENSTEFKVKGFLDDDKQLHGRFLFGKLVYSPKKLSKLITIKNISLVFLALPSISRNERNKIIELLNKYKLIVKTLPSISEIVNDRITISDVKDLQIDDLLNRYQIQPNNTLLEKNIYSKNVLVTGAGGSIGSELCRQIVRLKPKKIILLEISEFALYKIQDELRRYSLNIKIISLLMNVQDQKKLEIILETFNVDTVYHSAAYKHVPLVEENICEGVKNNVFSTLAIAQASIEKKVSNFVLISSDKAVRPTNIMGASKRLSELCVQGLYSFKKNNITNFSIVRFGNVLESSGSVIPKFREQIKQGGPVTLTHKDVTRYFMTVTEAAQLVIQAGAMGKKSEVFVLDMGNSIKIIDLIYKMIALSGLSVKDINNPNGDIEIKTIGLRPGEKLYEELLIGDNPVNTIHPKILMIEEDYIPFEKLEIDLKKLKTLIENNEAEEVRGFLKTIIKSFNVNSEIVDYYYVKKKSQTSLLN